MADIVLIDSPPALALADAAILSAHATGVVLIASLHRTDRDELVETAGALTARGAHVLGVVGNRSRRKLPKTYAAYISDAPPAVVPERAQLPVAAHEEAPAEVAEVADVAEVAVTAGTAPEPRPRRPRPIDPETGEPVARRPRPIDPETGEPVVRRRRPVDTDGNPRPRRPRPIDPETGLPVARRPRPIDPETGRPVVRTRRPVPPSDAAAHGTAGSNGRVNGHALELTDTPRPTDD